METAGKIIIETDVDQDGIDKGLEKLDKKIEEFHKIEEVRVLTDEEQSELDKIYEQYEKLYEEDLERSRVERQINDDLSNQSNEAEKVIQSLRETNPELYALSQILEENLKKYKELVDEIKNSDFVDQDDLEKAEQLKSKIQDILREIEKTTGTKFIVKGINSANNEIKKVNFNLNEIGTSMKKTIKNVVKWGLAIFGVRGAYMMIRNAINTISQDDQQLKADIDYMKAAIAYTLEPVVRTIVNLAKELMIVIQHIAYMLTGKNIFANADKSLKNAAKSAKEINKQIAPFDEMNILGGGSSGSSEGTTMPDFDLTKMNELSNTGKGLLGVIMAIGGAIAAIKISELLSNLGLIGETLGFKEGVGIAFILLSIYNIIKDLKEIWDEFDESVEGNNTTMRDWGDVVAWVGVGIAGLGLLVLGLPAIVGGAIVAVIGLIMKYWEEIKSFFTDKVFGWLDKMIEKLNKTTIGKFFATFFEEAKRVISDVLNIFDGLFRGIKQIFDGIILIFKGKFKEGMISIGKGIINGLIAIINTLVAGLNTLVAPLRSLLVAAGKVAGKNWSMENIKFPSIKYLRKGGIINLPGKGVPLGRELARGGEAAPEGVIPLSDSQQMALIGEAIGKYVNINATVPVYVGNRLIMREFKKINAEDNFAFNR